MSQALLIKNAAVYAPKYLGHKDILTINGTIVKISESIAESAANLPLEIIDARGRMLLPGYVDQHVHIIGGGGESGPYSRTPEVMLSEVTGAGVTTLVGVLGTDGTSRHGESLLAKARGLTHEGISAYILTGSYELPVKTITGEVRRDIVLIGEVLGAGEIALSDHRSSEPSKEELKRLLTQARLGGMLAGKAGTVQFHMGTGSRGLQLLLEILEETEIPARHMLPTHINRAEKLFQQAQLLARKGAYIDITSGIREQDGFPACIKPSEAIRLLTEAGVPMKQVTMSSDGNGCMSAALPDGTVRQLAVSMTSLHEEVRDALLSGTDKEIVISTVTANPARANGLYPQKGTVAEDSDADLLLLDENLYIDTVIAKGRIMVQNKKALVKGTFEK